MIWIIFSIIVFLMLFVGLSIHTEEVKSEDLYGRERTEEKLVFKRNKKQFLSLLALVILIPAFVTRIPANSVGIVYSPFSGTSNETLTEGFHLKNPFEKVYKINTEVQTKVVSDLTTQTQDAQYVNSILDIKYRVNRSNAYLIFTQFRTLENMSENLIVPTTQRVLELITTRYNVMDILGEKRNEVYSTLEAEMAKEFEKYGVEFYSISIADMDAGQSIEDAITKQAVAKQEVETAEQELLKAETEAKKESVTAQAKQDAAKIKAETKLIEAKAEKEANELIEKSLSQEILTQAWIDKWSGNVPEYYGGNGADLIFNTGKITE